MSNSNAIENLVQQVIDIEKETMKKRFDLESGLGKKYASDKADSNAVNKIISLVSEVSEDED